MWHFNAHLLIEFLANLVIDIKSFPPLDVQYSNGQSLSSWKFLKNSAHHKGTFPKVNVNFPVGLVFPGQVKLTWSSSVEVISSSSASELSEASELLEDSVLSGVSRTRWGFLFREAMMVLDWNGKMECYTIHLERH